MKTLLIILFPFILNSQTDSELHMIAGNLITGYVGSSAYYFGLKPIESVTIGGVAGAGAGVLKEYVHDRYLKRGTFSKVDMYDTFWGATTGVVFLRVGINEWEKKNLIDTLNFQFNTEKIITDEHQR